MPDDRPRTRAALALPPATDRIVRALYGATAALDASGQHWVLATVLGGRGDACRIERASGTFHDSSAGSVKCEGNLVDAAALVLGLDDAEAARWIAARGGSGWEQQGTVVPFPVRRRLPGRQPAAMPPHASPDHAERLRARLLASPAAMAFLTEGLGLSRRTIRRFDLGLSAPPPMKKAGSRHGESPRSAITAPVIGRDGLRQARLIKVGVPGLSTRAEAPAIWCPGGAVSYWSGAADGATDLFVVSRVTDLWRVAQTLEKNARASSVIVITSTHPTEIPAEWLEPEYWLGWRHVYIGCGADRAGTDMRERVRKAALRDLLDVAPPGAAGWVEFFQGGGTSAQLEELLAKAKPASAPLQMRREPLPLEMEPDGFYGAEPIAINFAWVRGHLHYAFSGRETMSLPMGRPSRDKEPESARFFRYRTRVVRSDGTILDCRELPAPAGTSRADRIVALSNGTVITAIPSPREFATWRWESIARWKAALDAGQPPHRPLRDILADVRRYIERMTWLPLRADYALLAAYVAMTYTYPVFDAVPNLLINGAKGSGKSTTARGIAWLSFNGFVLGKGSGESFIRVVDQGRGLLVLDDLEKVGRNADANGYGNINQILKLSYSKAESKKSVLEGKHTRVLDFFGPKVITNISGIDEVNRTRMFLIAMRTMPPDIAEAGFVTGPNPLVSEPLRQELHAWGMTQAAVVSEIYRAVLAARSTRFDEICAPIRAIVRAADDPELEPDVEEALRRQDPAAESVSDPVECLEAAVAACVRRRGSPFVSLTEVQLALASMLERVQHAGASDVMAPPWIGRKLRELGIVEADEPARRRLHGAITKIYRVRPEVLRKLHASASGRAEVRADAGAKDRELQAFAFCEQTECRACPYLAVCDRVCPGLRQAKQEARGASAQRHARTGRADTSDEGNASAAHAPDVRSEEESHP